MIILVELCIALSRHASVSHDYIHAVRNVNLHLSSGKGTLVDAQTVIEVIGDTGRVCAAHLAFSGERVQDFVLRVSAQTLLKID